MSGFSRMDIIRRLILLIAAILYSGKVLFPCRILHNKWGERTSFFIRDEKIVGIIKIKKRDALPCS